MTIFLSFFIFLLKLIQYNLINSYIIRFGPDIEVVLFGALFILLWNLENIVGFLGSYKKWKHASINFPFIFTDIPVQFIMGMLFVKTTQWVSTHHFGFSHLYFFNHHPLMMFLASFLVLDFGEYIYHMIMHRVKRLWMFHLVHHTDPIVDVSTTLREHPGETFTRLCFTLVWTFLGGIPFWALIMRQIIQSVATPLVHANIQLPERVEKTLSLLFITPGLHQVHHHYKQPYTDCNYGDVLSIWDRMFGTLKRLDPSELKYGVDTFMEEEITDKYTSLIKLPFMKYRSNKDLI